MTSKNSLETMAFTLIFNFLGLMILTHGRIRDGMTDVYW